MKISEETRKKADKVYPYVVWFCIVGFALCAVLTTVMLVIEVAHGRSDAIEIICGILIVIMIYCEIRYDFLDGLSQWKKKQRGGE